MRPGKAPASPTSRPVIVGHKPEMKDEMVGGTTSKVGSKEKRPLLSALAKVTIQPSHGFEESQPTAPAKTEAPTPTPEPTPAPEPQAEVPAPASTPEATAPDNVAANPSVNLPPEPMDQSRPKPLSDQLLAAAAKEPENPNPMMQHGENVYVSHHKGSFTFGQALLTILAIVVLTAIAINFLLDADVIKTDMNVPHTNWL